MAYALGACRKDRSANLQPLPQEIPSGFPPPVYSFADNPLSKEGFELGRRLFFDGRLSIDGNFPCASCHQPIAAFGTYEHDRSHGYDHSHTLRNAPPLFNLAWQTNFHWDGEFGSLVEEAQQPITTHTEMAETFAGIISKLQQDAAYRREFEQVFGSPIIKKQNILKALAQFTGYLTSANSKYDRVKNGTATFTQQETNGYQVFMANCAGCHPEPLFTDNSFRNTGLPVDPVLNDLGRIRVTGAGEDLRKFRVPSLRNVYVTANYMHDGRFNTLAQCINHYRSGIEQNPTLDPLLVGGIPMTDAGAADLRAFLIALTDSSFINDPRFKQP